LATTDCWRNGRIVSTVSVETGFTGYYQRRMDSANRRFLAAVKALALVRKLAVPALQVNIAKKQVNVVASAVVTPGATS
jgi:hypothetical protein